MHRAGVQHREAERRSRNIDDRVHGADVVEVHGLPGGAVRTRFGVRETRENPLGCRTRHGGELPGPEDREDVGQRAVRMMVMVVVLELDVDLRGAERAAPDLARGNRPSVEGQRRQLRPERVE